MQITKKIARIRTMYKMGKIGRIARVRYFDNYANVGMIEEYTTNIRLASLLRKSKENEIFITQILPIDKIECKRLEKIILG